MRSLADVRLGLVIAGLVAAATAVGARGGQFPPPPPPPPPGGGQSPGIAPTGTGLILGQTVDAATGSPVAGAVVTLLGRTPQAIGPTPVANAAALGSNHQVMTDAQGHFVFRDLPRGTYTFIVSLPGFTGGGYGQKRPTGPTRGLDLADGEKVGDVVLKLWKFASIAGVVLDEAGEPAVGLTIRALRRTLLGGVARLVPTGMVGVTDDRGMYRIGSLTPGDYVVVVPTTAVTMPVSVADEVARQSSGGPLGASGFMRTLLESGAPSASPSGFRVGDLILQDPAAFGRGLPPPTPSDRGPILAYQTLFYPAATSSADASTVTLQSGEERANVDVQLRLVPTVRVSGTVSGLDGPGTNLGLRLVPVGAQDLAADAGFETATTASDAAGAFTFLGVPAGSYVLKVLKVPRPQVAPMVTTVVLNGANTITMGTSANSPAPQPPTDPVLWASVPVAVGGSDVAGIAVSLRPGLRVSGQLVFHGAAAPPTPDQVQRAAVTMVPVGGRLNGPIAPSRTGADGQFTTAGYPPGTYTIVATIPAPGWTFASATLGGHDVDDQPIDLATGDASGAVITFADKSTTISGSVRAPSGESDGEAQVIAFPAAYDAWLENGMSPRRTRVANTDKTGAYRLAGLPVGEYLVVAVTDESVSESPDASYFKTLAGVATHVTLAAGEQRTVDLKTAHLR